MSDSPFSISTPIYYVNGKPHIGHAYTTVAADVVARYWRARGKDVFFVTGTDEHGAKNAESAEKAGKTPQVFVDEMAATFELAWDRLQISNDAFWRTSSDVHKDRAREIFSRLKTAGVLYEGEYEGLYCTGCEAFLTEKELDDKGECSDHKRKPEQLSEKNWFFTLSDFLPRVQKAIESGDLDIKPASAKSEVLGLIKQGLEDFSVSRQRVTWGVPLPFEEKQVAYVWVEALMNYVTSLGYGSDDESLFEKFWPMDVHVVGKDIIKFHCVFWPAMLMALDVPLPKRVFAHGFFTIDGQKMSKSLGNVIDPNELVDRFGADGARYLVLSQFPFGADGDVQAASFDEQYNSALANDLGNLVHRVTSMVEKYLGGHVSAGALDEKTAVMFPMLGVAEKNIEKAMEEMAIDDALDEIFKIVSRANALIEEEKPWELAKELETEKIAALFSDLLGALQALSKMLFPFFPETSDKIAERVGHSMSESGKPGVYDVSTGDPLFPRIEKA